MAGKNGKTEVEEQRLDAEHELPAADENENQLEGGSPPAPAGHVSEVEKLRSERDALLDRLARMQAEFDNARKRAAREQQDYRDYALGDAIKALIPVLDSFDRALQSSPEKSDFHIGVELIHKQLQDALGKIGVQPVSAKGQQFDPRFHEAIEMVETEDVPDQQVIEELQRGYKLKHRLLRPAMVKVARNTKPCSNANMPVSVKARLRKCQLRRRSAGEPGTRRDFRRGDTSEERKICQAT